MNDLLLRVLAVVLSGVSPELCWNGRNTALFGSILLPDWKRLMPDDTDTLRKILEYAEKRAVVPQDHADLANWYKKYSNIDKSKKDDHALL